MKTQSQLYLAVIISFIFLLFPLILNYDNIASNNKMLKYLSRDQIQFNFYAHKLNYDIKKNQATILQGLILKKVNEEINNQNFKEIKHSIRKLEQFVEEHPKLSDEFKETVKLIKKRAMAYNIVQQSLFDAISSADELDTEDAIIGFNDITIKFSKDTELLLDHANAELYQNIFLLEANNDFSRKMLIFSFLIAVFLITISVYKFTRLNTKLRSQLKKTQKAEKDLLSAQDKLLEYNDNLEEEILKKTAELHAKIYSSFLSGLPNRNRLLEDIRTHKFTKMAILNIDKFQSFNDVYGEEIGNVALQLSAEFLMEQISDKALMLYHIGGDEFCIVCTDSEKTTSSIFLDNIETILKNYKTEHFIYEDKSFQFMMSAGVSFSGGKKILAYTDMALKDAKKRNIQLLVFDEDKKLEKSHQEDIECHKKLVGALKRDDIISYFQPIVPIQDTTKDIKYESLVRIKNLDGSIIPPFNFLNVAKAHRIYYKITRCVIQNTLDTISKYHIPCSINFSLEDINNNLTMQHFYNLLDTFEYNELLTVELLETEDFDDYQTVYDFCMKVRSYGVKVALDDFGAGYSNFSHILNLPVDYIKIDASLISDIDRNHNSQIMVETIVDLAKKLHVSTIAEFVSSREILSTIKELGIDYAQGFHLGKPEPIEKHLKNNS